MESIGWSWRSLSAEVESKEAADAFFYTGAPVEAYQDCFYASAGTVVCRGGQRLARLCSFCFFFHHTDLYCPCCCNQRGVAAALRVGTLALIVTCVVTLYSNMVEEVLALFVTSRIF